MCPSNLVVSCLMSAIAERKNGTSKLHFPKIESLLYYRYSFVPNSVIEIGSVLPADNNDLNDRCTAYKKQQHKVTKQTGQCLTLSSVRLDLFSCCCFCPSFWAKSLHVGVHSTALTSLLGHELSYLWDMNRTWPRAQITGREEERPWQQRAAAQLSPSSPLLLGGFSAFPALCSAVESSVGLLKLISMHDEGRRQLFLLLGPLWAVLRSAGFVLCLCEVLDGARMWFIMWWSGGLNRRNHSQPHQAIWDHAALRHGCSLHTASL